MPHPSLLLLTVDAPVMIAIASAARRAAYTAHVGRVEESAIDTLRRTVPQVALVQIGHHAADSIAFSSLAQHLGTRVVLFSPRTDDPALRAAIALVSFRSPFPILTYDGDGDALVAQLEPALVP